MKRLMGAMILFLLGSCSEPPAPARSDAALSARPADASTPPALPDLGPPPRLTYTLKGVTTPAKITSKEQFRTETWKPKAGFKFVVVDAEVTLSRCDEPQIMGPKGFPTAGPLEKEVGLCSLTQRGDCVVNMLPFKGTKPEKAAAAASGEKAAAFSSTWAALVGADGKRVIAGGGSTEKKTCAGCELLVKTRCAIARTPNLYSIVFNVPAEFDIKAAVFDLDGARAPLAPFAP